MNQNDPKVIAQMAAIDRLPAVVREAELFLLRYDGEETEAIQALRNLCERCERLDPEFLQSMVEAFRDYEGKVDNLELDISSLESNLDDKEYEIESLEAEIEKLKEKVADLSGGQSDEVDE